MFGVLDGRDLETMLSSVAKTIVVVILCLAIEPSLVSIQDYRDVVTALGASIRELHLLAPTWTCQRERERKREIELSKERR